MRNLLFLTGFLILLSSCGVSLNSSSSTLPASAPLVKVNSGMRLTDPTARVNIKFVETAGDYLVMGVSYSGGCETHEFDLISEGKFTATYPPEVEVKLMHHDHNDRCRSIVDERLYFDLSPLQYSGTNKVRIRVLNMNTNQTIDYTY
jgi:hypothetical protein